MTTPMSYADAVSRGSVTTPSSATLTPAGGHLDHKEAFNMMMGGAASPNNNKGALLADNTKVDGLIAQPQMPYDSSSTKERSGSDSTPVDHIIGFAEGDFSINNSENFSHNKPKKILNKNHNNNNNNNNNKDHMESMNRHLHELIQRKEIYQAWKFAHEMLEMGKRVDGHFISFLLKRTMADKQVKYVHGAPMVDEQNRGVLRYALYTVTTLFLPHNRVDEVVFNAILDGYVRLEDSAQVEKMFKSMQEDYGVMPGVITYGIMIRLYGSQQRLDRAMFYWNKLRQDNLFPTTVTYGCILDACMKCNEVELAGQVFDVMKRCDGVPRNTVIYTTMFKGFVKTQHLEGALEFYRAMLKDGVEPNVITFNSLIDVAVRAGELLVASCLLNQMLDRKIQPDSISYATIAKGYCARGEVEKALSILTTHCQPSWLVKEKSLWTSLLESCLQSQNLKGAERIFAYMTDDAITPQVIGLIMKIYQESNEPTRAARLAYLYATNKRNGLQQKRTVLKMFLQQHGSTTNIESRLMTEMRNILSASEIQQSVNSPTDVVAASLRKGAGADGASALQNKQTSPFYLGDDGCFRAYVPAKQAFVPTPTNNNQKNTYNQYHVENNHMNYVNNMVNEHPHQHYPNNNRRTSYHESPASASTSYNQGGVSSTTSEVQGFVGNPQEGGNEHFSSYKEHAPPAINTTDEVNNVDVEDFYTPCEDLMAVVAGGDV